MFCCENCFGDRGLKRDIIPMYSDSSGECSFCNSKNVALISPSQLGDYFRMLVGIYKLSDNGKSLTELLLGDWGLFESIDSASAKVLLAEILDDGEVVRKKFIHSKSLASEALYTWNQLREELMYENRYFPKTKIDKGRLNKLLDYMLLLPDEIECNWYRARIQNSDRLYEENEMKAPPKGKASQGRANPAGIPYLYLASSEITAISEVRPHIGEDVCVAKFSIDQSLRIVNLVEPRRMVSPFVIGDENEISLVRGDIDFLVLLGNELTRPVLPGAAAIDYTPSQYLCEFIKQSGFHGVMYKSSMGNGVNLGSL